MPDVSRFPTGVRIASALTIPRPVDTIVLDPVTLQLWRSDNAVVAAYTQLTGTTLGIVGSALSAQQLIPGATGWPVTVDAALGLDALDNFLSCTFLDSADSGRGIVNLQIPTNATNMRITLTHRAATGPAGPVTVNVGLFGQTLIGGGAFSAVQVVQPTIPLGSTAFQIDTFTVALADLSLTPGQPGNLQITRDTVDGLTGSWLLRGVFVEFT